MRVPGQLDPANLNDYCSAIEVELWMTLGS